MIKGNDTRTQMKRCWGCGDKFLTYKPGHPLEQGYCGSAGEKQEVEKMVGLKRIRDQYVQCAGTQ